VKNTNNSRSLSYPLDLASTQKNHYILFNVFKTETKTAAEVGAQVGRALTGQNTSEGQNGAGPTFTGVTGTNIAGNTGVDTGGAEAFQAGLINSGNWAAQINTTPNQPGMVRANFAAKTLEQPLEQIALYIPDEVSLSENAQYGEASLIDALGDLTGGIIKKASSYIDKGGSALLRLGLNNLGYVFNPQEQLMFEGIDFRKFSMSFTFTPSSVAEAQAVNNIITTFRKNAAPDIGGFFGFFFIPPSQFMISYCSNGGKNNFIHNFKRSVLEDVTVNYAPNGWSAHAIDGAPVQTTLSLTFKEMELVTRSDIETLGY
jgi:hypothetical protein